MLFLLLLAAQFAAGEELGNGRLTGILARQDGRQLSHGVLYLFNGAAGPPPVIEKYWRIPDQTAELDDQGRFDLELTPGTYYLAYIKHDNPNDVGPPKNGEIIWVGRDLNSQPIAYRLGPGEMLNLGRLSEAVPYDPAMIKVGNGVITAIEGRIVGEDDKPIADAAVFAFMTPTTVGRPLFTSELSDNLGRFLLRVERGGTYYLKVRGKHGGGQPGQDSILDGERDERLAAVTVATGEIVKGVIHKALTLRGRKSKRKSPTGNESGRSSGRHADLDN